MYSLIFDSDALIKLAHSSAITCACESFNCIITNEVKRETVDEGKKRFYPDADLVEDLIYDGLLKIKKSNVTELSSKFGKGELSVLDLAKDVKKLIIITDDQAFIKELERENIDFLVPGDLIILLKKLKKIDKKQAKKHLDKIKVFIRENDYKRFEKELGVK